MKCTQAGAAQDGTMLTPGYAARMLPGYWGHLNHHLTDETV